MAEDVYRQSIERVIKLILGEQNSTISLTFQRFSDDRVAKFTVSLKRVQDSNDQKGSRKVSTRRTWRNRGHHECQCWHRPKKGVRWAWVLCVEDRIPWRGTDCATTARVCALVKDEGDAGDRRYVQHKTFACGVFNWQVWGRHQQGPKEGEKYYGEKDQIASFLGDERERLDQYTD